MASGLTMSDAILLELQCHGCKHHLSHFPIRITPEGHSFCNRCEHTILGPSTRNRTYEVLARLVKFPCLYSDLGCGAILLPADVPEHEQTCPYQTVNCPVTEFGKCDSKMPRNNILSHCKESHSGMFMGKGPFQVDHNASFQRENLVADSSQLFLVRQKFSATDRTMEFCLKKIWGAETEEETRWLLILTSLTRSLKASLSDQPVVLPLDCLFEEGEVPFFTGRLITKKEDVGGPRIHFRTLAVFKCANCQEYALPPLYCKENQTYCFDCTREPRGKGSAPARRASHALDGPTLLGGYFRNHVLERVANTLNYPCKYEGCSFMGQPKDMAFHLVSCLYATNLCPLSDFADCPWEGLGKDVKDHVSYRHSDMFLGSDIVEADIGNLPDVGSDNSTVECYIIEHMERLFLLHLEIGGPGVAFRWRMEMLSEYQPEFMYEIEVFDKDRNGSCRYQLPCVKMGSEKDCYFMKDQVEGFLSEEGALTFRVRVFH